MKVLPLGLQTSTTTSYSQTQTTLQGNVGSRIINDGNGSKTVLGPQPVITADVEDDTGSGPAGLHCSTPNGRIFIAKGFAAGVLTVSYYLRSTTAGVTTVVWQGDLKFTFTNTGAYTLRGMSVNDVSGSSMNIHFFTTNTTAIQGGWYAAFGINQTAFVKVSVQTLPVATTGSTNSVVYQIGDTTTQAAQTVTVADGGEDDTTNGFVYILNGAAATPKIFKFVDTVPTATPTAGYVQANGTIVVTGTLTALAGVVLLVNCVKLGTPGSWSSNSGSLCLMWITTTTIYHAKVSDITNGAVSLPSLASGNMAGSASYLTPSAAFGQYSGTLDKFVIMTSLGNVICKQGINNDSNALIFGLNTYIKTETGGTITPCDFGAVTNLCVTMSNGMIHMSNSSVGQRNLLVYDLTADENSVQNANASFPGQINASIISPVISGNFTQGTLMSVYYELSKRSVRPTVQYRTSNFSTGPGAGFDATWTSAPKDGDLTGLVNATQVQFRFLFTMMANEVTNPPQINETYFIYTDNTQISENWEGSLDNSTQSGASPMYVAFRMRSAYASVVPTLYVRGVDDTGNVIFLFNTVTNASVFSYSTNNGTSWNALGTIPNTPLTTEVRVNVASPSGTRLTWSIAES
jgi:hypothetical protein